MLTIKDLIEQFEIQGAYCIKTFDDKCDDVKMLASGRDFECEWYKIKKEWLNAEITYMYAVDGVLNIEIEVM